MTIPSGGGPNFANQPFPTQIAQITVTSTQSAFLGSTALTGLTSTNITTLITSTIVAPITATSIAALTITGPIQMRAVTNTTTGQIRFYESQDNGTTWKLVDVVSTPAQTLTTTTITSLVTSSNLVGKTLVGSGATSNLIGVMGSNTAETWVIQAPVAGT